MWNETPVSAALGPILWETANGLEVSILQPPEICCINISLQFVYNWSPHKQYAALCDPTF